MPTGTQLSPQQAKQQVTPPPPPQIGGPHYCIHVHILKIR